MTKHSLESSEKRRNLIIPEEKKCWNPTLVQALTGIKPWTQKKVQENKSKIIHSN